MCMSSEGIHVRFSKPRFIEETESIVVPFVSHNDAEIHVLMGNANELIKKAREHVQRNMEKVLVSRDINFSVYVATRTDFEGLFIKFSPPWW